MNLLQLGCGGAVLARPHRLMPVTRGEAPAPDVHALAARWAALADRELDVPVGVVPRPLDAREEVLRREPAPLGTYLAEVMRVRMGAHVGLLNGGAIRSNRMIPAGPVTRRAFRALLPFNNAIVLVEVTGTTLQATMERSVAALPRPAGAYLQTAGLTASVDISRPVGQRVLRLEVGGEAVVDDGLYRVALPDYLARGGDGYTMLARGRLLVGPESGPGLAETVMEAVSGGRLPCDRLTIPVLLLRGAESDLLSRTTAQAMTERGPKARLVEFAGVGHAPMLVQPEQVAAVSEFLLGA